MRPSRRRHLLDYDDSCNHPDNINCHQYHHHQNASSVSSPSSRSESPNSISSSPSSSEVGSESSPVHQGAMKASNSHNYHQLLRHNLNPFSNNPNVVFQRPRALSASYTEPRHLWGHNYHRFQQQEQYQHSHRPSVDRSQSQRTRRPVWQMSLPMDNDPYIAPPIPPYHTEPSSNYYNPDSSGADYRLGRYFDSMNANPVPQPAQQVTTTNYRSISFQNVVSKQAQKQPEISNDVDSRLKPVPRLPENSEVGLPVIRPKRSDSVRSTDSRTTTASSVSTLVPTVTLSSAIQSVQSTTTNSRMMSTSLPPEQSLDLLMTPPTAFCQDDSARSSIRSNSSNTSPPNQPSLSTLKKSGNSSGNVRRVRFADEPVVESFENNSKDDQDSRGGSPPDGAIVVVTKRLGPFMTSNQPPHQAQQPQQNLPPASVAQQSIMSMSINRVPPPYPHHRGAPQATTAEPTADSWRRVSNPGDFVDDGYDSVNQTPSEGSVNSTTSSSGLPPSSSPDHQQLDSSIEPSNQAQKQQPQQSRLTYSAVNYSQTPSLPPAGYPSFKSNTLQPPRHSVTTGQNQQRNSYIAPNDVYNPSPSYSNYQNTTTTTIAQHQPYRPGSYASSTLNLPSCNQSSQYRWLPGRSPSSVLTSSTLSLNHAAPSPNSYQGTLTRSSYASGYSSYQSATSLPLARAPSFRQLSGPEPVCVVAEHEFSSLLDSLAIGVVGRPNHL